jgi:O-antigen ligase
MLNNLSKTFILLFIFSVPWADVIPTISGSIPSFLGIGLVTVSVASLLSDTKMRKLQPVHYCIFLFFFWVTASLFWTEDQEKTYQRLGTYLQLFIFVYIFYQIIRTKIQIDGAFWAFFLGLWVASVSIIISWKEGIAFNSIETRYSSFDADPNDLALSLALGIPISFYLSRYTKNKYKVFPILYIPISIFSIFLTGSRSGLICAIIASLLSVSFLPSLSKATKLIALFVCVLFSIAALNIIPQDAINRFNQIPEQIMTLNLTNRVDLWHGGLKLFIDNVFTGIGPGAYRSIVGSITGLDNVAHNTPISLLVELGIVGFILFYYIVFWIFRQSWQLQPFERIFWLLVFFLLAIGTFGLTWEYRKIPWIILAIAISHVKAHLYEKNTHFGSYS